MRNRKCTVCGEGGRLWQNAALLGAKDALCCPCFRAWYEDGVTSYDEIKQARHKYVGQNYEAMRREE